MAPAAQKILDMIESYDSTISEARHEVEGLIDCAVEEMRQGKLVRFRKLSHADFGSEWVYLEKDHEGTEVQVLVPSYATSIDAQEDLRREGWALQVMQYIEFASSPNDIAGCGVNAWGPAGKKLTADCITEPLARLHAWVQVMGMEG